MRNDAWLEFASPVNVMHRSSHQTKGNNSRQTRDTTTKTWIACCNSTWHASKYKVYKVYQSYILKCVYGGVSIILDVPLVKFMYLVVTHMPGGVTMGDSGLCCCVPCLLCTIISLGLVLLNRRSRPHSVSDYCSNLYPSLFHSLRSLSPPPPPPPHPTSLCVCLWQSLGQSVCLCLYLSFCLPLKIELKKKQMHLNKEFYRDIDHAYTLHLYLQAKHQGVCAKNAAKKRKVFDSSKQRAVGTDLTYRQIKQAQKKVTLFTSAGRAKVTLYSSTTRIQVTVSSGWAKITLFSSSGRPKAML